MSLFVIKIGFRLIKLMSHAETRTHCNCLLLIREGYKHSQNFVGKGFRGIKNDECGGFEGEGGDRVDCELGSFVRLPRFSRNDGG